MTGPEYNVCDTLAQRVPLTRAELCRECDASAVTSLEERGLIAEVGTADPPGAPATALPEDPPYAAGHVDFTPQGYRLYRRVLFERHGPERVEDLESGWVVSPETRRIEVYGASARAVERRTSELATVLDDVVGAPAEVVAVGRPGLIGRWRPNRLIELPGGFRITVRYRTHDP